MNTHFCFLSWNDSVETKLEKRPMVDPFSFLFLFIFLNLMKCLYIIVSIRLYTLIWNYIENISTMIQIMEAKGVVFNYNSSDLFYDKFPCFYMNSHIIIISDLFISWLFNFMDYLDKYKGHHISLLHKLYFCKSFLCLNFEKHYLGVECISWRSLKVTNNQIKNLTKEVRGGREYFET